MERRDIQEENGRKKEKKKEKRERGNSALPLKRDSIKTVLWKDAGSRAKPRPIKQEEQ